MAAGRAEFIKFYNSFYLKPKVRKPLGVVFDAGKIIRRCPVDVTQIDVCLQPDIVYGRAVSFQFAHQNKELIRFRVLPSC